MERMGFVARIEEDLERTISQGRLPASRCLPSESLLARQYGVSRTTVREALLRLSARGLVVQHPGRKTRAIAMDVSVTLENLSVALHAEGPAHPERWRLLEGYLELKREMTVDLLSACCDHASESDLESLSNACFLLREEAKWKGRPGWVEREFNLLRLAAIAANRPGHFLLIQSLERSFWGMAKRLLPHLHGESICEWALAAFSALHDKDAQALRQKLPPLLQASDERLLRALTPAPDATSPFVVTDRPEEMFRKPPGEHEAAKSPPSEPHSSPDTLLSSELPENRSQQPHIESGPTPIETWLGEQESGSTFRPVTCEPPPDQLQDSGTTPGGATCRPTVEQNPEVDSVPGATGELSAEFCTNPSGCWTGSGPRGPTGGPPPESGP